MDRTIIQRLNAINRAFYHVTAKEFDQTRGQAWRGWEQLLPYLPGKLESVLDVGCGNGRFGVFLAQHRAEPFHYHGIDNNPALLAFARESLAKDAPSLHITLEQRDIIDLPLNTATFDLVVLFGVIHHVPGYAERQAFIRTLADRVTQNGLLVFACWRFYEYERFRERIVPWGDDLKEQIEHHDYLLDWRRGETALRYCHYVDDDEQTALVQATGLTELVRYRADGQGDTTNSYSILKND